MLELQKRIDELEAEQKAAANKARAQKLVSRLEKQGIALGDEEERESELKRLAGLSDDAFAATEAAWERMVKSRKAEGGKPDAGEAQQPEKKEWPADANLYCLTEPHIGRSPRMRKRQRDAGGVARGRGVCRP